MEARHRFSLGTQVGVQLAETRLRECDRASEIKRAHLLKLAARWDSVLKAMERIRQKRRQNMLGPSKGNGSPPLQ